MFGKGVKLFYKKVNKILKITQFFTIKNKINMINYKYNIQNNLKKVYKFVYYI